MTNRAKQILEKYSQNLTYSATSPVLIVRDGMLNWPIKHGLSTSNVYAGLFDLEGNEIEKTMTVVNANNIIISWPSEESASEGLYEILVVSGGAYGGVRIDTAVSATSTNPVQNAAIYQEIGNVEKVLRDINEGRN